jgi:hypothetical protein
MSQSTQWHDLGFATARQDPTDPAVWRYLPKAPNIQRGPDGRAQHSLIDAGGMVMLSFTTEFGMSEQQQNALRDAIVKAHAPQDKDSRPLPKEKISLQAEAVSITQARLQLVDGAKIKDLAKTSPSGYGLQTAAFMVSVAGPDADALKAAITGEKGRLCVTYEGSRYEQRVAAAALKGKIEDIIDGDTAPNSVEEAERVIEHALQEGFITLETSGDTDASEKLEKAALTKVRMLAAQGLSRFSQADPTGASGAIDANARETETITVPFKSELNIRF